MKHYFYFRTFRFAAAVAILIVSALLAGCGTQQCKDGNNSRFRCDPSASFAEPSPILPA